MTKSLKNKLIAVISGGALLIASVLIKDLEGVEYTPYYDVVGVLTVCYGHTGADIIKNKVYTQSECELLLEQDLLNVANQVDQLIKVELPETTRAAIYSFVYNVGIGNFAKSTLLKKINSNDPTACSELKRWVYADGIKWKGLMNRHDIEFAVCARSEL